MTTRMIKLGATEKSVRDIVRELKTAREKDFIDLTLEGYLKTHGETTQTLMKQLDLMGTFDTVPGGLDKLTIGKFLSLDEDTRWLVPEVFLEAVRIGVLGSPIASNLIRSEIAVDNLHATLPTLQKSDGQLAETPEAGVIRTGKVSYGQRTVSVKKYTAGIEFTDELIQYTPMDLVRVYFEDLGAIWGLQLDGFALDTLKNGDQADGSMAAASVGVLSTTNGITYKDILRIYIRASLIGRSTTSMLMNENMANTFFTLPEVLNRQQPYAPKFEGQPVNFSLPTSENIIIHPSIADNQIIFVNKARALVKLNAQPLSIEGERIVNRQMEGRYVSLTTGFANLFMDGRIILDGTKLFSSFGFPTWFNITALK